MPALIDALGSKSEDARAWAADALGRMGPDAKGAVPALARSIRREGAVKSVFAAKALGKISLATSEAIGTLHDAYDSLKPGEDDSAVAARSDEPNRRRRAQD